MAVTAATIGLVAFAVLFLIITTPIIAKGMRRFYHLLALYHPTPGDLQLYLVDKDGENPDDYITEDWLTKFGMTYAINFISATPTLMLVLVYGVVFLRRPMSFGAIFGSGIVIVAINSSLRIGEKFNTRWGRSFETDFDLLSFGYTFFTSLWVLTILGVTITILNGNVDSVATLVTGDNLGPLNSAIAWGFTYVGFLIAIPLLTEYCLANKIDIDHKDIDFELKADR